MPTPAAPRPLTGQGVRVLLVGTGTYDHLADVPAVAQTLADLAAALVNKCGLDRRNLMTIRDPADPREVGTALARVAGEATDVLLFYFVGHGLVSSDGHLFLGTTEVHPEPHMLPWTGVPYDGVRRALLNTSARTTVVILDCCFSGRAVGALSGGSGADEAADLAEVEGSYVLTASARDQLALAPVGEVHTAFTGALLRLLASGDATAGPQLTLAHIYQGLSRALPARGLPKPQIRVSATAADLVLLANPAYTPPAAADPLPVELTAALSDPLSWKRAGALFELENQLSSRRPDVREAAKSALLRLVRDVDPAVSGRAVALWHTRGLDKISLPAAAPQSVTQRRASNRTNATLPAGIDFGTTNSAVVVWQEGECRVVPNRLGERTTPSVAGLSADGSWLVGSPAKRRPPVDAATNVASVKSKLGTDWTTHIGGREVDAEEVATAILAELRSAAEDRLNAPLGEVVLTVPAYFTLGQRHATVEAARRAGLTVQRLVNEPTAAALAYGVSNEAEQTLLVFDLGGGTFDVSLLEVGNGIAEVKATSGDNHLGGDDWDQRIVDWLVERIRAQHGVDLTGDAAAVHRLREAAETAKIELSTALRTHIPLDYLAPGLSTECSLTRGEFEDITNDLLERTRGPIISVLRDVGMTFTDIDTVLLVGGSTRMPAIGTLVEGVTGRTPKRDIIPDGVAVGAAITAAVMAGQTSERLLLDVTPLSLGLETKGGVMTKLIERNTTIPAKRSEIFTTADDDQTQISVQLFQGEAFFTADNTFVGTFELTDIPPAPRGVPKIEVSFDINANGVLYVSARDLTTSKEARLTVTGHLSSADAKRSRPGERPDGLDRPRRRQPRA